MKTIAFLLPPFYGHVTPTLPIGKHLIQKGYRVYWVCPMPTLSGMVPPGGYFYDLKANTKAPPKTSIKGNTIKTYGMDSITRLYKQTLMPLNKALFTPLKQFLEEVRPDFTVVDHQLFAGALACYTFNVPFATSVTAPAAIDRSEQFPKVIKFENDQIRSFQEEMGVFKEGPLICNSKLTLIFTLEEFVRQKCFARSYKFVGPIPTKRRDEVTFPYAKLEQEYGKHRVLVSLGSILKREQGFIEMVCEALAEDPKFTVVLVAEPKMKSEWPSNFMVQSFIPQQNVLNHIDLVVCHAGHNTVMESLSHGIPLIALPIINDQSHVASGITENGAGIRLKYRRVNARILKESIWEIIDNSAYLAAAKQLRTKILGMDSVQKSVRYIQENVNSL